MANEQLPDAKIPTVYIFMKWNSICSVPSRPHWIEVRVQFHKAKFLGSYRLVQDSLVVKGNYDYTTAEYQWHDLEVPMYCGSTKWSHSIHVPGVHVCRVFQQKSCNRVP
jgi:hypothetical protein